MKIGLFFGSFNPMHVGHKIIASYMAEFSDLDEVWFVVTPQSPFKQKASMLSNHHRLAIANIAVDTVFAEELEVSVGDIVEVDWFVNEDDGRVRKEGTFRIVINSRNLQRHLYYLLMIVVKV